MDFISSKHPKESGIIYCLGRDTCEKVAKKLESAGFSAGHFHAGMTPTDKDATLDEWRSGRIHIIVATVKYNDHTHHKMCSPHSFRLPLGWELINQMVNRSP